MDFTTLDENLALMIANIELEGETCGLKHSKNDPAENHYAVDYLCQIIGTKNDGSDTQELRIPICKECVSALNDKDWILCYCTYCHESQWIYRPKSKIGHPDGNGVYWLDVCPHCAEIVNEYKGKGELNE